MELGREEVGRRGKAAVRRATGITATGVGAGLKVILWILTKFDYTIIKIHMKTCSFLWSVC